MEFLATITAAPVPLVLGGRLYWMSPLTLRDYGEVACIVGAQRDDEDATVTARLKLAARSGHEVRRICSSRATARW